MRTTLQNKGSFRGGQPRYNAAATETDSALRDEDAGSLFKTR